MEQLKLKFDGRRLLIGPGFKKHTVNLYRPTDKIPTVVAGIWAKSEKQAIVKAIKMIHGRGFSMRESRAYPQRP